MVAEFESFVAVPLNLPSDNWGGGAFKVWFFFHAS